MTDDAASGDAALDVAADPPLADDARPAFSAVDSHDALRRWSAAYCERAVREHGLAVDLSLVDWAVSTRAKRRAAAVKRPRLADAAVGERFDWDAVDPESRRCTVSLTWDAFAAFDLAAWAGVLRHELVHVEQFQRFGTTDHGPAFERRAAAVDATLECPRFATPKYRLRCADCGGVVARRYRDCPLVRNHADYASSCCDGALSCERPGGG